MKVIISSRYREQTGFKSSTIYHLPGRHCNYSHMTITQLSEHERTVTITQILLRISDFIVTFVKITISINRYQTIVNSPIIPKFIR